VRSLNSFTKVALVIFVLVAGALHAHSDSEISSQAHVDALQLYSELNSPYCPGRLLQDCPSSAAVDLKEEILRELSSGKEREVLRSELLKRFGDDINPLPSFSGFNLFAWLIPSFFFLLGCGVIGRKATHHYSNSTASDTARITNEQQRRIDELITSNDM
jgi:cytochrome c-type biogenesis protein CcmH/NrfF